MTEKGLITDLEEAVNQQIIKPFIEANFPPEQQRIAELKLDPLSFERKITVKEVFVEMLRNLESMVQLGIAPNSLPSVEKMAKILEVPIESWEDATGISQEDFKKFMMEAKKPVASPTGDKGTTPGTTPKKKPRKKSVDQTADRKGNNPASRRASRKRDSTKRTKEN